MDVFKSILLIVYFVPFGIVCGQFRIVGLLNVDGDPKPEKNQATAYQTNAQGRGFSIDDELKNFLIRPKDIIRVHVIDDLNQSDQIPQTDNILMLRRKRPIVQQSTETTVTTTKMIAITKKPTKSDKMKEQTKRPTHNQQQQQQQRNIWRSQPNKYLLHKFSNVISNSVNRSSVPLKHHKPTKRHTYKSRCRCERISNCPRMQISVTRCQPNYFMCCF